ncbi:MAG: acyl-CoA/acyl-ACP dehydrogenase [Desulfobacteraceae bacterium]|nr:acyl-CoA/acyl-ACP dehydrogenase [Desulfobacteraceae bacterium]
MNFQLDKSQKEIQKAAREFAKGEFDGDLVLEEEKMGKFPEKIRKKAADLGFIGVHYHEKYNGGGLGLFENILLAEEFCRRESSVGIALMLSGFSAECILRFGSENLKTRWLPMVTKGEALAGAAFTEKMAGFDLADITTSAKAEDGGWVINGSKNQILNGSTAGFYCVLCQTDPEARPPKPKSLILVEADRQGLKVENIRNKLGMRMSTTADLRFESVRVPYENLIGRRGQGLSQVYSFYNEAWILIASLALGTAKGAFSKAIDYVKKREQFGRVIAKFQVTQHKIARMASRIEEASAFVYKTATDFDHGKNRLAVGAMAKLCACQTAIEVTNEAIQMLGGYGYMREYGLERFYRDAKAMELFCGNTGFLKDIVNREILGNAKYRQ